MSESLILTALGFAAGFMGGVLAYIENSRDSPQAKPKPSTPGFAEIFPAYPNEKIKSDYVTYYRLCERLKLRLSQNFRHDYRNDELVKDLETFRAKLTWEPLRRVLWDHDAELYRDISQIISSDKGTEAKAYAFLRQVLAYFDELIKEPIVPSYATAHYDLALKILVDLPSFRRSEDIEKLNEIREVLLSQSPEADVIGHIYFLEQKIREILTKLATGEEHKDETVNMMLAQSAHWIAY